MASHLTESQLKKQLRNRDYLRAVEVLERWPKYADSEQIFLVELGKAIKSALQVLQSRNPKPAVPGQINVAAVKGSADIVEVAQRYAGLRKAGKNYVGLCPFHEEKHPSFTVYPETQSWYCFSCNKGGDVITLVMRAEGVDFKSALASLAGGSR